MSDLLLAADVKRAFIARISAAHLPSIWRQGEGRIASRLRAARASGGGMKPGKIAAPKGRFCQPFQADWYDPLQHRKILLPFFRKI
jgi:hypothetical protein